MILKNAKVLCDDFTFKNVDIGIADNKITFSPDKASAVLDCDGCMIVPGLIDIHTHGALGYETMDLSYEAVDTVSRFMAENGVTTYLPNIMTESHKKMLAAAKNIGDAAKQGSSGASIGGIYMEGPYFSEKYKGAQNPNYLRNPSCEEFDEFSKASGGIIKIIALAPELEGAFEFIEAKKDEVNISIGHTDADYETAAKAIQLGASVLTHTFNGMRGFHHRNPNAVGAAFDSDIFCECICDGFHLSKTAINMLYKTVGKDRMVLISDSLRTTGMPDGESTSGGQTIYVVNGEARLADGTIAGSNARLFDCVKKAIAFGVKTEDAFRMATLNPAKAAGIDDITGSITEGKRADLLVLNPDLSIKNVIVSGKIYR